MALRVLIIPDKFKGTLSASEAADAMARGWRAVRPADSIQLLPMTDGGDGFGEILSDLLQAKVQTLKTLDAAHRPCEAAWWWHEGTRRAIIESARVVGLAQLPPGKYHPFELDTEGLGQVLRAVSERGAESCLVGIGGSATNDGGFGMARTLGWEFINAGHDRITRWTELHTLVRVHPPERPPAFKELIVAVDVWNPLLGPQGCSRIYGPQKGLRPEDFEFAERCLQQMARVVGQETQLNYAVEPGAGAAGGLGFGLRCFAGARLESGFELFCRLAKVPDRLKAAQLVLSGEGSIDDSTLMGKGVGELAGRCRELGVPCLGLAGAVTDPERARQRFTQTFAISPDLTTREQALSQPGLWLERLAARAARVWDQV